VPLSQPARDLQASIDGVLKKVPHALAVVLGTADGLLVSASDGLDRGVGDELAAVSCGVVFIVAGSRVRMFGDDQVDIAVVRLRRRVLVVKPVGDEYVLATVAGPDVDVPNACSTAAELARRAAKVMTPELREELQQALPM
jgi:uncharacterized protein